MDSLNSLQSNVVKAFDNYSGMLFLTTQTADIVYVNKFVKYQTGYAKTEVLGKTPGNLWGGNMSDIFYLRMWYNIKERRKPFVEDIINTNKNGYLYKDRLYIAPIYDVNEKIKFFLQFSPAKNFSDRQKKDFEREFLHIFNRQKYYRGDVFVWMLRWLNYSQPIKEFGFFSRNLDELFSFLFPIDNVSNNLFRKISKTYKKFPSFYLIYKDTIYQYFFSRLQNKHLAEDLMQETFYKAFKYSVNFYPVSENVYKTYLLRIAHNLLVNYFRKKKEPNYDKFPDNLQYFNEDYDLKLLKEEIWKGIKYLSKVEQEIMKMRYKSYMSIREIAVFLGKTENAVKLHISRAKKKLKKIFND